jgi:hypothetical protein
VSELETGSVHKPDSIDVFIPPVFGPRADVSKFHVYKMTDVSTRAFPLKDASVSPVYMHNFINIYSEIKTRCHF